MKCCICGNKIETEPITKWDSGNNAQPIKDGRCCNDCNITKVLPERIRLLKVNEAIVLDCEVK